MWLYWQLFVVGLPLLGRERQDLVLENIVLRQLAIHECHGHRASLEPMDRRFWSVTRAVGTVGARTFASSNPRRSWAGIAALGDATGGGRVAVVLWGHKIGSACLTAALRVMRLPPIGEVTDAAVPSALDDHAGRLVSRKGET